MEKNSKDINENQTRHANQLYLYLNKIQSAALQQMINSETFYEQENIQKIYRNKGNSIISLLNRNRKIDQ